MKGFRKQSSRKSLSESPFFNTTRSPNTSGDYYGLEKGERTKSPDGPSPRHSILPQRSVRTPRFYTMDPSEQHKKMDREPEDDVKRLRTWDSCIVLVAIITALVLLLLIIIMIYVYLGTLIYRQDYQEPSRKSGFYFGLNHLNFSEAMEACSHKRMSLAVLITELEENVLFEKIFSNKTILDKCPSLFVGYRIAPDKEWSGPKNETAFGAMFSDMWEKSTYDLERETCSQAIKVANYKLNNVVCNFPNDCVICETASHCPNNEQICYFLERLFPKVNHSEAKKICDLNYNGQLALIRSEALRIMMIQLLSTEDPLQFCKAVAVGMQLKRQVETIDGLNMAYKSTRLKLNQGDAMDYCVSAKTRDHIEVLSTQSCTDKTCYVCRM